ncbi:MAG: hypothetical protein R3B40_04955 [Polyangiales bacterium]|nr:hypothetical protein [Myxococcales bacterium]MCB9662086.1 hypothetical protein [Sandaracinaceae bacterium]
MSHPRSWTSLTLLLSIATGVVATSAPTRAAAQADTPPSSEAAPADQPPPASSGPAAADQPSPPPPPPATDEGASGDSGAPAPSSPDARRRPDGSVDTADVTQSGILSDEQVLTEQAYGVETVRRGTDPYEDPNKRYFFLGGFYHHHFIPSGMVEIFVQHSPSISNPQAGLELTIRRDSFEIIASAWYADFTTEGPFLANGDPPDDVEIIDSNLRSVMVGATFMWSTMFNDYIGLEYGLGLGVGYVFGDLVRTEAYPSEQHGGFQPCTTPIIGGGPGGAQPGDDIDASRSNGLGIEQYCQGASGEPGMEPISNEDGERGAHYGVVARKWFDGGSVPNLWFRLAPQISLRIKPIHQLVIRADVGFDIFSGIYVGGGLAIGLN